MKRLSTTHCIVVNTSLSGATPYFHIWLHRNRLMHLNIKPTVLFLPIFEVTFHDKRSRKLWCSRRKRYQLELSGASSSMMRMSFCAAFWTGCMWSWKVVAYLIGCCRRFAMAVSGLVLGHTSSRVSAEAGRRHRFRWSYASDSPKNRLLSHGKRAVLCSAYHFEIKWPFVLIAAWLQHIFTSCNVVCTTMRLNFGWNGSMPHICWRRGWVDVSPWNGVAFWFTGRVEITAEILQFIVCSFFLLWVMDGRAEKKDISCHDVRGFLGNVKRGGKKWMKVP